MKVPILVCIVFVSVVATSSGSNLVPDNVSLNLKHFPEIVPQLDPSQPTLIALQKLPKVFGSIINHGLEAIETVQQSVDLHLDDLIRKTVILHETSNQNIEAYIQEAKQNLTNNGNHVSDCLTELPQRLQQISNHSIENTKTCFDNFVVRVNIIRSNVKKHIDFVAENVQELQNIIETCATEHPNLIAQIKCVLDHIDDAKIIVSEIVQDTEKLLTETMQESVSLANDTNACLLDVVKQAQTDVYQLLTELYDCMHNEQLSSEN
ncbi:uncharacterized protein LOC131685090 [Topomyia yanbarensis]|uniref:uncharacterized protein LOC131685090 n=1 Tax=Topomyia yanbarensis TaxID=2498891 RepID=UPI00273C65F4|nr:uncharacterized protein LOC131685090 [Topomyia yanbarensis]